MTDDERVDGRGSAVLPQVSPAASTFDPGAEFERERARAIARLGTDGAMKRATTDWIRQANALRYSYNFTAFGRPIIQYPQDMAAIQELVWRVRPTVVIETGIAHGGSLVWSAGLLALLDYADAAESGDFAGLAASRRRVIGIDIDIRSHNRAAIEHHPFWHKIKMLEGSSISTETIRSVKDDLSEDDVVIVMLDSNHCHDHVLEELRAYAPLVSRNSYCIVFDTIIDDLPGGSFVDRPWDVGNNPKTAVRHYLAYLEREAVLASDGHRLHFETDREMDNRLLISVAPTGYLRRVDVA